VCVSVTVCVGSWSLGLGRWVRSLGAGRCGVGSWSLGVGPWVLVYYFVMVLCVGLLCVVVVCVPNRLPRTSSL
jgi:hypothetical protein